MSNEDRGSIIGAAVVGLISLVALTTGCLHDWLNPNNGTVVTPTTTTIPPPPATTVVPPPPTSTTQPAGRPARYIPGDFGGMIYPTIGGTFWCAAGNCQGKDQEQVKEISLAAPDGSSLGVVEVDGNTWFVRRKVTDCPAGMIWRLNAHQYRIADPAKEQVFR